MYYRLKDDVALRKWKYVDRAVYIKGVVHALPASVQEFDKLLLCDGNHDVEKDEVVEKLLDEFNQIAGVNDLTKARKIFSGELSGTALELLINQESDRLKMTVDQIKNSLVEIGKMILKLYKQFANIKRMSKIVDDNGKIELFYWNNSDISSDDVVLDTNNELNETISQKRQMIFALLNAGLLSDENGTMSVTTKQQILDMIGFGSYENVRDMDKLHSQRAGNENLDIVSNIPVKVLNVDDNQIHIKEHTAFLLSISSNTVKDYDRVVNDLLDHIENHKQNIK